MSIYSAHSDFWFWYKWPSNGGALAICILLDEITYFDSAVIQSGSWPPTPDSISPGSEPAPASHQYGGPLSLSELYFSSGT